MWSIEFWRDRALLLGGFLRPQIHITVRTSELLRKSGFGDGRTDVIPGIEPVLHEDDLNRRLNIQEYIPGATQSFMNCDFVCSDVYLSHL